MRRLRRVPLLLILLAAGGFAVRLACLQGLIRPVRVVGASMAPALVGSHYEAICADCGAAFCFGLERPPARDLAVCPNCGFEKNPLQAASLRRGRRVWIDHWPLFVRRPRRWEVIAFRAPAEGGELAVKRVAGLPGERVAIRDGDLYIDGRIARKSLDQLRALAIPVYDDSHRPTRTPGLPPRWAGESPASGWRREEEGFSYRPGGSGGAADSPLDWLTYRHWRCEPQTTPPAPRTAESPVVDNYGYNQGLSRGRLFPVHDLMLACRAELAGAGCLALRASDGRASFEVRLLPQRGEVRLLRDGRMLGLVRRRSFEHRTIQWELALCDRRVLLAMDRRLVLQIPYEASSRRFASTPRPLGLGARSLTVRLSRLQVFRDIHYLGPDAMSDCWRRDAPLGRNEYFVLGDNPPLSVDSRQWRPAGIASPSILGKVVLPHRSG